jgi:hypothetical protein
MSQELYVLVVLPETEVRGCPFGVPPLVDYELDGLVEARAIPLRIAECKTSLLLEASATLVRCIDSPRACGFG